MSAVALLILNLWLASPGSTPQQRFDDAAALARRGAYRRAADQLQTITAPAPLAARATVLAAEALMAIGCNDEATAILDAQAQASAGLYRARAALARDAGDYPAALEHARKALALDGDDHHVRYDLGRLYELTGDFDAASETYAPLERVLFDTLPTDPEQLHYAGLGFYRYSVINRVPRLAERTRHVLQEILQPACMILDLTYWPARLSIADLLREKYSLEEAFEDYRAVLEINPHCLGAHLGIARIALENWDFENTERRVQVCLDIDPRSVDALAILAGLRMLERRFEDARATAEAGLALNPNHLECLGLLASAHLRLGQPEQADAVLEHVRTISARPARVHAIIGKQLSDARQFPESERHLLTAIELDPSDPWPRNELAMMYMQWGREDAARQTAEGAFDLDQFNAQTKHTLDLLQVIEGFDTHMTDHFEIHYDGQHDAIIGHYMGDYLESIYAELTDDFEVELPERTIIEVFPDHRQFGVRIHGKPWIHTIGACTGRVIAMDAPRHGVSGPYHYAHVLRHEFTHTVTLAATDNRIPHWFTEGLAVLQEDRPRSWDWMVMLAQRLQRDGLFKLSEIDWGFIRPRRRDDRQVAYAQSEWMCEYLIERFGYDVINHMLNEFRAGRPLPVVLRDTTDLTVTAFDEAFDAWARRQAAGWRLPIDRPTDRSAAALLNWIYPRSPRLLAERARLAREQDDPQTSATLAARAVAIDGSSPAAQRAAAEAQLMLAGLAMTEAQQREHILAACEHYRLLIDADPDAADAAEFLAEWAQEHDDREAAITWAGRLRTLQPANPAGHRVLAWAALAEHRDDDALPHLLELSQQDEHDADVPRQIARIYHDRGHLREAASWYRTALWIDAYDAEIHRAYAALLTELNDNAAAITEYRMLTLLEPGNARGHADLAFALHAAGRRDEAAAAARRAVTIDPQSPAGQLLAD